MSVFRKPLDPSPRRKHVSTALACLIAFLGAPLALAEQPAEAHTPHNITLDFRPIFRTPSLSSSSADSDLPDAPGIPLQQRHPGQANETNDPNALANNGTHQTKRILGIMPNFRSVSADTKLPPLSPRQKFILAGKDTFDYSSFFIASIQAGFSMSGDSYPEFHQGVAGFGRYYWHTLADTIDENFMVGGLGPIVFHQDNRFYTLGHGGFARRTAYAWTRVLVSRKDDGSRTPNFAELIGSGASSGVSTLYYPTHYRTWTKVGQKWLTSDLIDGANFMLKEFWPDINKFLSHAH